MSNVVPSQDEALLLRVLTPFVRRWRLVVGVPIACGLVAATLSLILPKKYTAITTFVPQASATEAIPGALASFAGQFGLTLGSGGGDSPDFYAKVLTSHEILRATLTSSYPDPAAEQQAAERTLLEILEVDGDSPEERINEGIRDLEDRIAATVDRQTGIVKLEVELLSPELAANVANRMVGLLNSFNLERLQSQSREQRRFTGERLALAERELREAEDSLLRFLQSNRRYTDSPLLSFEASRRERQVQLRQDVVLTLRREYEQARIAEVRDTPLLTIIDRATPPDKKSSPRLLLNVLVALILGGTVALFLAYADEFRARAATVDSEGYGTFVRSVGSALDEIRAALRMRKRP